MGGKISKESIYLRIYKQNFFDLTLVDLPGLTYVDGLGRFIANIYEDFIKNPNSIILYVTSATTDLVTGQSIELIDTHDKEWQRTMTIVTKVDARDSTFYQKFKVVDRGLGGFCVRNRTTDEIHQGVSHAEVLQKERVLLSDPDFAEIPSEQKGIPMLIKALIGHQREMILRFKPVLRQQLSSHKHKTEALLNKLPKCYNTVLEKN